MPADTGTGANPNVTRSRLVLEIASEMAGSAASDAVPTHVQPRVVLRHARGGKPATFLGVSTAEGIFAVASREVDLAIINPAAVLSVAMRGKGIFTQPMPVLTIGVGGLGAVLLPQFAAGGGWATEIVITNTNTTASTVRVDLFKQDGTPLTTGLNGQTASSFTNLTILPGGVLVLAPRNRNGDDDF